MHFDSSTVRSPAAELLSKIMVRIRRERPPLGRYQTSHVRIDRAMGAKRRYHAQHTSSRLGPSRYSRSDG